MSFAFFRVAPRRPRSAACEAHSQGDVRHRAVFPKLHFGLRQVRRDVGALSRLPPPGMEFVVRLIVLCPRRRARSRRERDHQLDQRAATPATLATEEPQRLEPSLASVPSGWRRVVKEEIARRRCRRRGRQGLPVTLVAGGEVLVRRSHHGRRRSRDRWRSRGRGARWQRRRGAHRGRARCRGRERRRRFVCRRGVCRSARCGLSLVGRSRL